MDISVQTLPKHEIRFSITFADEELKKFREVAASMISKRIEIPGFRQGKAPPFAVEAHVGKPVFFREVLRFAIVEGLNEAVKREKLNLIASPRITVISESPLKFEALSCLLPQIDITDYKNVKPKKIPEEVSPEELEDIIREILKMHATREAREGGVELGDRVEIDFQGYDESGVPLEKAQSKQHPLYVGEGTLIKGFEEQLVGMKAGEKKKFFLTFPPDFHHQLLRGKRVHFEVDMKRAEKVTLPLLDEAFVEKVMGQKASVEAFKEQLEKDAKFQKKQEARRMQEAELIEAWLKNCSLEIPSILLEEEIDFLLEEMKRDLEARGQKWEKLLEYMASQKKDLRTLKRQDAERRVKIRLMLNEIMRRENIEATREEVEAVIENLVQKQPKEEQEKVRIYLKTDRGRLSQIINSIRLKKLFDRFLATA